MSSRMHIVVGHYGSGKTEFAINYALSLKERYQRVYLVDLDIVNPYFRTNDVKEELKNLGIDVIASEFASTNLDIPALPPEITKVFAEENAAVVFDVGGDDDGAIALGRYRLHFENEPYEMFLVINTFRPMTREKEDIIAMLTDIERVSRLNVTGLIHNSNLAHLTTIKHLLEGQEKAEQVSEILQLPIVSIVGLAEVVEQIPGEYKNKVFSIHRYLENHIM